MSGAANPYILATGPSEPDRAFDGLGDLAVHLVELRAEMTSRPDLMAIHAAVARGCLPHGQAVSVRALDGSHGGRGRLIGYVFLPDGEMAAGAPNRIMGAVADVQADLDEQARRVAA